MASFLINISYNLKKKTYDEYWVLTIYTYSKKIILNIYLTYIFNIYVYSVFTLSFSAVDSSFFFRVIKKGFFFFSVIKKTTLSLWYLRQNLQIGMEVPLAVYIVSPLLRVFPQNQILLINKNHTHLNKIQKIIQKIWQKKQDQ